MIITPLLVLFIAIVFILLFLFLNTVDKRKWLTALISLALTPLVYFYMFYPFLNIISNYHHQKIFNSNDWKEKPALRYEMIDYTISSDTLIGITKDSIESLLGQHEWLSWDKALNAHDSSKWNYSLGIKPGAFTNKKECIELSFINNKLTELKPYQEEITYNEE